MERDETGKKMKVALSSLIEGKNKFHFDSQKEEWLKTLVSELSSQGYKLQSPLVVDMELTKVEPEFYLQGTIDFSVEQNCSRCAENFPLIVNSTFELALAKIPSIKYRSAEVTEETEKLDVNFFEGNEIDLNPIVVEQFFLSIPYQSLCKVNCSGVCHQCGTNLNNKPCHCAEKTSLTPFSVLQEIKLFKQE